MTRADRDIQRGCATYGHVMARHGHCHYCRRGPAGDLATLIEETGDYGQPYGDGEAIQVLYRGQRPNWRYYRLADYVVTSHCSGPSIVLVPRILDTQTTRKE